MLQLKHLANLFSVSSCMLNIESKCFCQSRFGGKVLHCVSLKKKISPGQKSVDNYQKNQIQLLLPVYSLPRCQETE